MFPDVHELARPVRLTRAPSRHAQTRREDEAQGKEPNACRRDHGWVIMKEHRRGLNIETMRRKT
jgi:hypothetical protein